MTIPDPTVPFDQVERELALGNTFWTMRGKPVPQSKVVIFFASMFEDDGETYPGIDYVGGFWSDQSGGEDDWMELDEAAEEFSLRELVWHVTVGVFEPGLTPEYTVRALLGT